MSVSRPHAPASVAGRDAPLIGDRGATRGRIATRWRWRAVKSPFISSRSNLANRIEPREPDPLAATCRSRLTFHKATPAASDATRDARARR
jgi:hypothetical protein